MDSTDGLRPALYELCCNVRELAQHTFHAHEMAWTMYTAMLESVPSFDEHYRNANPPTLANIKHSFDETIQRLDVIVALLQPSTPDVDAEDEEDGEAET